MLRIQATYSNMRLLLPLSLLLLLSHTPVAQTDEPIHPIDQRMQTCLDDEETYSTSEILECIGAAYDDWDLEMNRVYQELLLGVAALDDDSEHVHDGVEHLRASQRAWMQFRDAEVELLYNIYYRQLQFGTIGRMDAEFRRVDLIRQRTRELSDYPSSGGD